MVGYCITKNCITNGLLPIIVHTFPLNACAESLVRTFIVILKLLKYFITTQGRVLDRISVHAFHAIHLLHAPVLHTTDWFAQQVARSASPQS